MSLRKGAETVILQCLNISKNEEVVILDDGNDEELLKALTQVLNQHGSNFRIIEYEEPENHGEEPPKEVAEEMKDCDVFIAPTKKSLSHTKARVEACEAGVRGATLPGITKEIWNTSLQADYREVERLSNKVYKLLSDTDKVKVKTPSGTDLSFEININYFHKDTGIIHNSGEFGNLPAGEADGAPVKMNGTLVVDHLPFAENSERMKIKIEDNKVKEIEGKEDSELSKKFESVEGAKNIAEFGFGTNPEAELIGNILQDEKVLGTVHIAFGDNTSYVPKNDDKRVSADIHWDTVCKNPTVWFDDTKILDNGKPVFTG